MIEDPWQHFDLDSNKRTSPTSEEIIQNKTDEHKSISNNNSDNDDSDPNDSAEDA